MQSGRTKIVHCNEQPYTLVGKKRNVLFDSEQIESVLKQTFLLSFLMESSIFKRIAAKMEHIEGAVDRYDNSLICDDVKNGKRL